jgi:hypothetical protein
MIAKLKPGMLSGHDQQGRRAAGGEGMGDRAKLDGFRARADDKRDT